MSPREQDSPSSLWGRHPVPSSRKRGRELPRMYHSWELENKHLRKEKHQEHGLFICVSSESRGLCPHLQGTSQPQKRMPQSKRIAVEPGLEGFWPFWIAPDPGSRLRQPKSDLGIKIEKGHLRRQLS